MSRKNLLLLLCLYFSLNSFSQDINTHSADITSIDFIKLTPKPAKKPRLNNALVYGCGPNRDFLYRIPCQGQRPIAFSAKGLPQSLKLDKNSGIIKGKSPSKGIYNVVLTAKNKHGSSTRQFQINSNGELGLTPPMGWSSWFGFYDRITDKIVRQTADLMISTGMADVGYNYVNIDDCWNISTPDNKMMLLGDSTRYGTPRDADGNILPNRHFPDMNAMTDYIHQKGLKAGIYSSPGPLTCMKFIGAYKHEQKDAIQFANWGFDFLKYDLCGYRDVEPYKSVKDNSKPYVFMGNILKNIDRDIFYSICQYGNYEVWKWGDSVGGNSWRTAGDLGIQELDKIFEVALQNASVGEYNKPGGWNDPDYISIGYFGSNLTRGYPEKTKMSPWLQYSYMSLWTMMASPIIYSGDLSQIDEFTLNVLCNPEIIEINQDPLGKCGKVIMHGTKQFLMIKELYDGSKAVAMFNRDHNPAKITASWQEVGVSSWQQLRDVWKHKDIGAHQKEFSSLIPAQGCIVVKMTPIKNKATT